MKIFLALALVPMMSIASCAADDTKPAEPSTLDPAKAISVKELMAKVAELRKPYGKQLTALQVDTLRDDLARWASGKAVEVPLIADEIGQKGDSVTISMAVPAHWGKLTSEERHALPAPPSFESPDVLIELKPFPTSIPKDQAIGMSPGDTVTAYFSVLPAEKPKAWIAPDCKIQFQGHGSVLRRGDDKDSVYLKLLDVRR